MSTAEKHIEELAGNQAWQAMDEQINELTLVMEGQNSILALQVSQLERVVTIYLYIKPLLEMVTLLRGFPPSWRTALKLFISALDNVVMTTTEPDDADFKAGKDLAIEEME